MASRAGVVLIIGGLCVADVMLAGAGRRLMTLGLDVGAVGLALIAVYCLRWRRARLWVFVFLLVVPVALASFAWVPSVSSEGLPVAIYLIAVISGGYRMRCYT